MHYHDRLPIDSMMKKLNIDKWLVYQVKLLNDSIIYSDDDDDKIVTFLFWMDKGQTNIKLFSNTHIYSTCKLNNARIFDYKNLEKVWADNKENNFKIVPAVIELFDYEVVIHNTGNGEFFFVFGNNTFYTDDPKKYKYRKEFIEIIRHEAITNLKRLDKVESNYDRKPL